MSIVKQLSVATTAVAITIIEGHMIYCFTKTEVQILGLNMIALWSLYNHTAVCLKSLV